jgi:hypothetical protein
MHKSGVFITLILGGLTAACAERMVNPAVIPKSAPAPKAASKPRPSNVDARRQAERIAETARQRSDSRSQQVSPHASVRPEQPPEPEIPPQVSQSREATPTGREAVAVLPPPVEPDESNFPFAALMPPPPEPAEPTFPSAPPTVELPPPPEPAAPILPEVSIEAAMPPPPEPAQPSFPVAALMPPSLEPAEPSLPSQEEIAAESPVPIPYPDLSAPLSLHPRFDWGEVTGSFEIPRRPMSEAFETSPEGQIPSLIRNPWPLPVDAL